MTLSETPHSLSLEALYVLYESTAEGITPEEASLRLRAYGPNALTEESRSPFALFIGQFTSPIVIILIVAALLSYAMGNSTDAVIILSILVINSLLGWYQEYRAETSIRALKKLTETHVRVLRKKHEIFVPSDLLVPGDIVLLGEGERVPADLRLIEAYALEADEAIITGESIPSPKQATEVLSPEALPYERSNTLFSGTYIIKGSGRGMVTATGENTYLASIAQSAREKSPDSPLTRSLAVFSKRLLVLLVGMLSLVGIAGVWQGRAISEMASILIAELVSAVPEGLPIVVTLILALGAYRLSRHNVLVRHLPSVEALGSASVIITDKTGTITEGFLSVRSMEVLDEAALRVCSAVCNDAQLGRGDPVDTALARWIADEYSSLREENPRVFVHPFDAKLRLMATVNQNGTTRMLYVKGAYEALISMAHNPPEEVERLEIAHTQMASQGLRLLAFGVCEGEWENPQGWDIRIVGLIGFADAAKGDAAESVRAAKGAGIRVIMVTGDNPLTARAIAREVGIWEEKDTLLSGSDVEVMEDGALKQALDGCSVVARALPEHKYRIVKLLQEQGEIVAVTGDGVNDVPALKAADLGIAMGGGSEAAKSTAKMVITDNRLSVIVDAIRQGRIIAANLRKVIFYLVATCFDEIIVITGAIMLGLPLPIHPLQILWINVVSDGVVDKTFSMCREEGSVMHRLPRRIEKQFFDRWQVARIGWVSLVNASVALTLFYYLIAGGHAYEEALTVSFCVIVISQWVNSILAQKEDEPFLYNLRSSLTINPALWIGLGIGVSLQMIALYAVPEWFHAISPDVLMWSYIGAAAVIVFVLLEGYKWGEWRLKKKMGILR